MNWREWLADDRLLGVNQVESTALLLLLALVGSLLSSLLISFLYVRFYGSRATGSQIHRAFLLVGPSITAIFIAIQFSLPLSLGLLGALSIVRFRMPIKEAEEIGFILLVVAVSLSWATLNVRLLGMLLLVAIAGLLLASAWSWLRGARGDGMVVITLPASEYSQKSGELLAALESSLPKGRIDSISESHDESTISYSFPRLDKTAMLELQRKVTDVASGASAHFFFNQSGAA
jgi:hypothetical protein